MRAIISCSMFLPENARRYLCVCVVLECGVLIALQNAGRCGERVVVKRLTPPEANTFVKLTMERIMHSHDLLLNGEFRATETSMERPIGLKEANVTESQESVVRFDRVRQSMCCDVTIGAGTLKGFGVRFVEEGERLYIRDRGSTDVSVYRRSECPRILTRPFEIRTLGLCNILALTERVSFDKLEDDFQNQYECLEAKTYEDGTSEMLFDLPKAGLRVALSVDTKRGHLPFRLEQMFRNSGNVLATTDVKWEERAGAWVPTTLIGSYKDRNIEKLREVKFVWSHVNLPFDDAKGRVDCRAVADGDALIDFTNELQKPTAQRVGAPNGAAVRRAIEREADELEVKPDTGLQMPVTNWRQILLVLNVAGILIVICVVLWRVRTRR